MHSSRLASRRVFLVQVGEVERLFHAARERASWVQRRCPRLWADAARELHALYGEDLSQDTRAAAPLYLALFAAGELSAQACAELLRPFAELEATRAYYWREIKPRYGAASICPKMPA